MSYSIKEVQYTLQGEGYHTGRPAIFCRFTGCNLWSGLEEDRYSAICQFCDTDFRGTEGDGGGIFGSAEMLADHLFQFWPKNPTSNPFVVCTGGEPFLQLDQKLVDAFHERQFEIAVETNGTLHPPENIDWLCVSPKAGSELVQKSGNELKLVYPQGSFSPEQFIHLDFLHFFLQPMDGPDIKKNTKQSIEYCQQHPHWRLSLQTHKFLGIP